MGIVRPAAVALALAAAALAVGAGAALAECPPGPDDPQLNVGYAFTAHVVEASADVGPPKPDNAPFDWHLELAIDRVYKGNLPDTMAFDGWEAGCYGIRGDQMREGDRLFILSQHFDMRHLPNDPLYGDFLMWKRHEGAWVYYADALGENIEDVWITRAMRRASTTPAILRLARSHPPDTATASNPAEPAAASGAPWLPLGGALVVGGLAAFRHTSRRRSV